MCKHLLILVVVMSLSMVSLSGVAYDAGIAYEEFLERVDEVYELDAFSNEMKDVLYKVTSMEVKE